MINLNVQWYSKEEKTPQEGQKILILCLASNRNDTVVETLTFKKDSILYKVAANVFWCDYPIEVQKSSLNQ